MSQDLVRGGSSQPATAGGRDQAARRQEVTDEIQMVVELAESIVGEEFRRSGERDKPSVRNAMQLLCLTPAHSSETPKLNAAFYATKDKKGRSRSEPVFYERQDGSHEPADPREASDWLMDRVTALQNAHFIASAPNTVMGGAARAERDHDAAAAIGDLPVLVDVLLERMRFAKERAFEMAKTDRKAGEDLQQQFAKIEQVLERYRTCDLEGAVHDTLETATIQTNPKFGAHQDFHFMKDAAQQISAAGDKGRTNAMAVRNQILDNKFKEVKFGGDSAVNKKTVKPRVVKVEVVEPEDSGREGGGPLKIGRAVIESKGRQEGETWAAITGPSLNDPAEETITLTAAELAAALKQVGLGVIGAAMGSGNFDQVASDAIEAAKRQKPGEGADQVIDM